MSRLTDAWNRTYDAQTRMLADADSSDNGTRFATVGNVTGKCLLGVDALNSTLNLDSFSVDGTVDFQMLASDFSSMPTGQPSVEVMGLKGLYAADISFNNGIFYIKAANRTAGSK